MPWAVERRSLRQKSSCQRTRWRRSMRRSSPPSWCAIILPRSAPGTPRPTSIAPWQSIRRRCRRCPTRSAPAAQLVDPNTWQLVIRPPHPKGAADGLYSETLAQAPAAARATMNERRDASETKPDPIETEYATEFEVPVRVDIAADGRQVTVGLARQALAVKQRIRVVPRRDNAAMVTAEAEMPEGVWIPGDMQLYRDGAYVGSTYWQAQAKTKVLLPFGRDERVQVAIN